VLKCAGVGLSVPTQKVQARFLSDAPPTITCTDQDHKAIERFQVRELSLAEHYRSALSVETHEEVGVFLDSA
jgi:hypothetical protein